MRPGFFVLLGLCVLVFVEVAVLVPVIITQRQADEQVASLAMQAQTDELAVRLNATIASFMYSVARAAAIAPETGFLAQERLEDALVTDEDPISTPGTLYVWVPLVALAAQADYEAFYNTSITHVLNGTSTLVPYAPGVSSFFGNGFYAPFTLFVPANAPEANASLIGADLFSVQSLAVQFKNRTRFLIAPSALLNRTLNNYGLIAAASNSHGKGFMLGRVGSQELLEFSLGGTPRSAVTLAAYVATANSTRQALFFDLSPLLGTPTTLALFEVLPARPQFRVARFASFGEQIVVAVRYDPAYEARYAGNTWVILAAVLAPVCFLIDIIWIILALLWQRRRKLLLLEQRKRQEAQVMISYVNHGEKSAACWLWFFLTRLR